MTVSVNFEQARFNMVEQQIRPWDVLDQEVLGLLLAVKREDFVPAAYRNLAYADTAIPLGHGAEMLHPLIEGHGLQALQLKKHEKVLEVGTGSGYMAALLAAHAEQVWTVEIEPALAQVAKANLQKAGIGNVAVETGDGLLGLAAHAPFDAIMVSGAVEEIPAALLQQLKVNGRLFAVVGSAPVQTMTLVTRVGENDYRSEALLEAGAPMLRTAVKPAFIF
ncbi:MAG: protein-L-isoaspartate O-methyltransferase [Rhodocyclaceae bacterium]|nr:MAG: protein-L-isoaspartate O-methyltransferase [Rhodocyclaceae bacterium]